MAPEWKNDWQENISRINSFYLTGDFRRGSRVHTAPRGLPASGSGLLQKGEKMAGESHFLKKKCLGPVLEEKMSGESYGGCTWMYKIIQKRWPEYFRKWKKKSL